MISIGAQNCYHKDNFGSYTGAISPYMIKVSGAKYVIIGQSDNRADGDTDKILREKISFALKLLHLEGLERRLPSDLSGGQRQRIALARAFYRKTKFLVLDEATSSLDEKTESDVIHSLEIVGRRCTTVVIAHRLNTLSKCDHIYEINDGLVVSSGNYTDLCDPNHPLGRSVKENRKFNL